MFVRVNSAGRNPSGKRYLGDGKEDNARDDEDDEINGMLLAPLVVTLTMPEETEEQLNFVHIAVVDTPH